MSTIDSLGEATVRRSKDVLDFSVSYVTLRTRALLGVIERADDRRRIELYAVFIGISFAISVSVNFALGNGEAPSLFLIGNELVWRIIRSILSLSPVLVLFWAKQRRLLHLPIAILSFQQIVVAIVLSAAAAVMVGPEPAHTDFSRLELGEAQGTAAYELTCGSLERQAKIVALGRKITADSDIIERADSESNKGNSTSTESIQLKSGIIEDMTAANMAQLDELRMDQTAIDEFYRTYPNVAWSEYVAWTGVVIVVVISAWHLARGLMFNVLTQRARVIRAALTGLAFALGIAISIGLTAASAYPEQSEFVLQYEGRKPITSDEFEKAVHAFNNGQRRREGRLRAEFEENRTRCRGVRNYGLW